MGIDYGGSTMSTTIEMVDLLKEKLNVSSDYAVAKALSISTQRMSNYRTGRTHFDELMAYKVAILLDMDPAEVVARIHMERAKRPEDQAAWRQILKEMGSAAAVLLIVIGSFFTPAPAQASNNVSAGTLHIMLNIRRWWRCLRPLVEDLAY